MSNIYCGTRCITTSSGYHQVPNSPLITSHIVYSRVKKGLCESGEHNTLTQIPLFCFTNETQR